MWPKGEYLSVREAAQRAGRDPETIRRWIWKGKLQAFKIGGQYLIAPSAVDDALYFQEQEKAGVRIGEPASEYRVRDEDQPNITPEERAQIFQEIEREYEWVEDYGFEESRKLRDELFRKYGYFDVVGAVRESHEDHHA